MNKVLFCVYGTLKAKYGNNRLLKADGVSFKGTFVTEPKFTMVSCGGFPAVHCEGNTSIECELYEVTNPEVIHRVYSLEGYSGKQGAPNNWYDVEEIDTPHGKASMFVFRDAIKRPIVESGKW
jgi:gamma-glutamylcyclotransferase (GGCT)/AIG2-like uncharacterized protein YtfP